jgi:uncharacterized integral membrane protein
MSMQKPPEDADKSPAFTETKEYNAKLIAGLVFVLLGLIFVLQNQKKVKTTFLFFDVEVRLWVGLLVSLVIGAIIGQVIESWWDRRRERRKKDKR